MSTENQTFQRVIGFDSHPDSFTALILRGSTPAQAVIEKEFAKTPLSQMSNWAKKHTTAEDIIVLEASGNSFQIVRTLLEMGRKALVLESCQLGKLKDAHANNDKMSALRIAKAFLAGTTKSVWIPDTKAQERRDWFHAHQKASKRTTQMRNRILSYLNDNGARLKKGVHLAGDKLADQQIYSLKTWSIRQRQVLEIYLAELHHAETQRKHWRSLIAQEVLADPQLLQIVRLCGVREMVAFALGAIVGDINRFASPASLVKYVGLNPALDQSGENAWHGGIGRHGRKDLRSLLMEGAQAIMRSKTQPLAKWGRRLLARKSKLNLAVAAVARKLTVAIWYLMKGRWTELEEIDAPLSVKVGKLIGAVGKETLTKLGKEPKKLREEIYALLKAGKHIYLLDEIKTLA